MLKYAIGIIFFVVSGVYFVADYIRSSDADHERADYLLKLQHNKLAIDESYRSYIKSGKRSSFAVDPDIEEIMTGFQKSALLGKSVRQTAGSVIGKLCSDKSAANALVGGDGVFTDKQTGLMWAACPLSLNGSEGCENDKSTLYTYRQANQIVNTLNYSGFTDWRLPTLSEAVTLNTPYCVNNAEYIREARLLIHPFASGTNDMRDENLAHAVGLQVGDYRSSAQGIVMLVRGG